MLPLKSLTDTRLKFMKALEFCQAWLSCQKMFGCIQNPWQVCMCTEYLGIQADVKYIPFCFWKDSILRSVFSLSYQMVMEDLFLCVSGVSDQYSQRVSAH